IELVDLRTEAVSALTSRHSSAVTGLAFDPNGLLMSSSGAGNSGALRVLDTRGLDKQTGIAPIVNAVLLDAAVLDMAVYFDGDFTYIGALTAAGFELYEAHNPNRLQLVTFEEE